MARKQPMEKPAMPVRPIHHRRNGEPRRSSETGLRSAYFAFPRCHRCFVLSRFRPICVRLPTLRKTVIPYKQVLREYQAFLARMSQRNPPRSSGDAPSVRLHEFYPFPSHIGHRRNAEPELAALHEGSQSIASLSPAKGRIDSCGRNLRISRVMYPTGHRLESRSRYVVLRRAAPGISCGWRLFPIDARSFALSASKRDRWRTALTRNGIVALRYGKVSAEWTPSLLEESL